MLTNWLEQKNRSRTLLNQTEWRVCLGCTLHTTRNVVEAAASFRRLFFIDLWLSEVWWMVYHWWGRLWVEEGGSMVPFNHNNIVMNLVPDPSQSLKLYCCSKMLLGRPSGWQQETTCVSHEFHPINFWRGLSPKGHLVYHAQQRSIQIWQTKKLRTTVSTQWWYADDKFCYFLIAKNSLTPNSGLLFREFMPISGFNFRK